MTLQTEKSPHPAKEFSLFDKLIVILKWKKFILLTTLSAVALTAVISFIIPKVYRAETSILPPQQSSSGMAAQLMSHLGGSGLEGMLSGMKTTNELYIALLKSRVVLDRITERFHLLEAYQAKYQEDARIKLTGNLNIDNDKKSNLITIRVENNDPKTAADMANAFVEELKNLTQEIAVTEASQRRLFFEEQLKNTKLSLLQAENALKGFQEKTGTIEIKEQAKAIIESIAHLRAQIAAKEVQRKVSLSYTTSRNPDIQRLDDELNGMKTQLVKLEGKGGTGPDPLMSSRRMPAAGTDYIRRLRDLKYQETLFELLAKQFEMAKIDEARDATIIQVVYKATPPEKRIKPKRTNMVLIAMFGGLFFSVITVFLIEHFQTVLTAPEAKSKLNTLIKLASFHNAKQAD